MKSRFIFPDDLISGSEITLSAEESHHLAKVLRLEKGAGVEIANGRGQLAEGTVLSTAVRGAKIAIGPVSSAAPLSRVWIGFGLTKPAALEFILRRATEIGVAGFQPLVTRHSMRFSEWNERRWSKILLEVCKQCQELSFPKLAPPVPLESWVSKRDPSRTLILFDETDRRAHAPISAQASGYDILVGPEGGWSPEEVQRLRDAGAVCCGLGNNRLRAEMAAVVGAVLIKREIGEI